MLELRVVKRESHGLAYLRSARQYQSSGRPERRSAVSTRFEGGHAIFFISLRSAPAARPADVQPNALFSLIISQGSTRKKTSSKFASCSRLAAAYFIGNYKLGGTHTHWRVSAAARAAG